MDYVLFAVSSFIAFIIAVLYYRSNEEKRRLEDRLGEVLLREHERKNQQDMDARFDGRSDADVFTEAVQRGLNAEMPKPPRNKGNKP